MRKAVAILFPLHTILPSVNVLINVTAAKRSSGLLK